MKPNSKKKRPAKNVARSVTKTRKVSAKKSAMREGVILAPIRSGGTGAAILFFDEADILFGKRTAVRDSHDRYSPPPKSRAKNLKNGKTRKRPA